MDDNKSAMEAAPEAGSPRTQVTKSSKSGITLHYMARSELRRAVKGFRELKQIVSEENASHQSDSSKELKRRIKELEQTTTELNGILEETENRFEDADNLSLSRLMEMIGKDERIKDLEAQLNTKEQHIQSTEATTEELEHGYRQQLTESRASYDQLRESSWCDIKLLREEMNELQEASRVKDEEIRTLKNMPATTIKLLREEVSELQKASRLKDEEILTLKNESASKEATAILLIASHVMLQADLKDQLRSSKEAHDEFFALMDKKVQSLQEEKEKAVEGTNALKEITQSLEDTISILKDKSEEAERNRKEQLVSSKLAQDELQAKHTTLEVECKRTQSKTKLMDEEIKSLKDKVHDTTEKDNLLTEANGYLKSSLDSSSKLYEELQAKHNKHLDSSKQAQVKLQVKCTSLKVECKSMQSETKMMDEEIKSLKAEALQATENAAMISKTNQSLEQSIQALKKEVEESDRVLKQRYDELLASNKLYENQHKIAMDTKDQQILTKDKEVQALKEETCKYKAGVDTMMSNNSKAFARLLKGSLVDQGAPVKTNGPRLRKRKSSPEV